MTIVPIAVGTDITCETTSSIQCDTGTIQISSASVTAVNGDTNCEFYLDITDSDEITQCENKQQCEYNTNFINHNCGSEITHCTTIQFSCCMFYMCIYFISI